MANNIIKRVWNQNRIVHIDDLRGMLFQAESGGHTFQISGIDDAGNVIALSGSVAGVFMRPDNTDVAITGSASGGVVSVTLPAECYSVPGRFGLTVFVTDSGQKTAVYAAIGTVSRTSSGTVSPGTTADVVDLINQINAAVATIPASWTGLMADIAPTYSDAAVYPVGAYVYYNGDLYRCTTAITTAESWTAGHWTAAVLGNDVSELKSAIGDVETAMGMEYAPVSGTEVANYSLYTQNGKLYRSYSATSHYYTAEVTPGNKYQISGTESGYNVFFGTAIGESIPNGGNIGTISDTEPHLYTAPTGATKLFYSSNVDVTVTAYDASNKTYELANAVQKNAEDIAEIKVKSKKTYMIDHPSKVLMPEFASHFWCSNFIPNAFTGEAVVMTVSGTAGNNYLTVSNIAPNTIALTDVSRHTGFVLTEDGVHYTVYDAKYNAENERLEIYPKLNKNISGAILASVFLDSGANYTGLHLTEHGYKAYVEHMYSQNPKHCEIGLYNEAFDSRTLGASSQYPFQKIGTGQLALEMAALGLSNLYLKNYFPMRFSAVFVSSYTPYTAKNGVYWDVDLNGTSGYLELIMNAKAPTLSTLPDGQEVYVDVYIDGVLKSQTIITDPVGKRICVDYDNATSGRLEVYCNKWAAISGSSSGFEISKAVWWINEMKYPENAKMFPKGVFVAQEFDSWGVYNDGVTGETLQEFISNDAGVTVPLENHSLGSQTTAWGLAYWYQNVHAYHPAIAITDFGINDTNSVSYSSIPETITGPDGKVYNNKITQETFVENTGKLIDFAISNGIQPIVMRNFQHFYYNFIDAAIEGLSHKYGE